jgi:NADPH-dependent glutamate synthase beta subunit-like oxidoreductase
MRRVSAKSAAAAGKDTHVDRVAKVMARLASAQSGAWRGTQSKKRRRIVGIGAGGTALESLSLRQGMSERRERNARQRKEQHFAPRQNHGPTDTIRCASHDAAKPTHWTLRDWLRLL